MRLIDADALPRQKMLEARGNGQYEEVEIVNGSDIDMAPTIDHVQVVRCEDCKHSQYDELFHMRWCNGEEVKNDDFCSYGAKMDLDTTGE